MVWKRIVLVMMVLGLPVQLAKAQESSDSGDRSNILALEHAWDQAQERGDVKALAAVFDNSLVYVDYDGELLTKAAYLGRVKANNIHMEQIVADEMSVELFGNTAIVVGTYRVKGMENGKPYLRRGRFTDTWVRTKGNWICVAAATTPLLR
jgi:ketosteroid isomerase-like protein